MGPGFAAANGPRCMARYVAVGSTAEIPVGGAKAFVVGDREVAVFNVDGTFYGIENACPHQGAPLAEGTLEGTTVTCPWHGWCFDVTNGTMPVPLSTVDTFGVQIEGTTLSIAEEPGI